ncbi:plasmid pRiA4b ORF-3 family protein [Xanthomonas nasturtii]|uniref:Plasmid pRiA4b ORF-3 family protein n=1 Tax=Xanthomonas nasturtii TaxID=1843581 RepID=A0A3E1KN71_9XANT|nr:plasmid pRiA4b ORF-3 family protein [Xanthomonas nasturtii]MCL1530268.1 plasmid pRiA4b ORF-3 family protein [Xanthomonas nasturtii]MCL1565055.1 plasmid pRiA4b ORF-3 family protein [Xanthomonas nasturtii]MCL1568772.1 plasmid pRiA4b ORF-3 family protein [Xanthomonas nasturtii]MCL1572592.1 plasmid pRiA4b ORF-3 family protein [Xanthomonas nasturtii]MCL1580278.1 plasmid pRiA4b ORF-3 family protein [Xanthomonas nasturtii]
MTKAKKKAAQLVLPAPSPVYQLQVSLVDSTPLIWRRVQVTGAVRLATLHRVLQAAMGWNAVHPYEFDLGGGRYGEAGLDVPERSRLKHAARVSVESAVGELEWFDYFYGAGAGWQHRVQVEAILPPDAGLRVARCLDGANACPPENSQGLQAYQALLQIIADPDHAQHVQELATLGGRFDPGHFDLAEVNRLLARVRE